MNAEYIKKENLSSDEEKRMEYLWGVLSEVMKKAKSLPPFTLEVLISLGMKFISEDAPFRRTNLSGCEGKFIHELSQSKLEKIFLWATGFSRDIRFIAMRQVKVNNNYSVEELRKEIKEKTNHYLKDDKDLTLRIQRGNGTKISKPIRNISLGDDYLVSSHDSLSLRLNGGELVEFLPGDTLSIFPRPVSVIREMTVRHTEDVINEEGKIEKYHFKENKEINLGGGFICKLSGFDPKSKIFTLKFNFVANNGEPRDIGNNDPDHPESEMEIKVIEKNGSFVLADKVFSKNLEESIGSKEMDDVWRNVAENVINQESKALLKLFSVLLTLYPKLDFHAIKGFYAIQYNQETGKYEFSSACFDFESAEQAQVVKPELSKASVAGSDLFLDLVYEKLNSLGGKKLSYLDKTFLTLAYERHFALKERKLDPAEYLVLAHLAEGKYIHRHDIEEPAKVSNVSPEEFKKILFYVVSESGISITVADAIKMITKYLNENMKSFKNYVFPKVSDLIRGIRSFEDVFLSQDIMKHKVVRIARKETNEIIQSLVGKRYSSHSAESLFGKLMWTHIAKSDRTKMLDWEVPGYKNVYEYKGKDGSTAIILDQGDFQIGFLIIDGKVANLEEHLNAFLGSVQPLKKVLNASKRVRDTGFIPEEVGLNVENITDRTQAIRRVIFKNMGLEIPEAAMWRDLGTD